MGRPPTCTWRSAPNSQRKGSIMEIKSKLLELFIQYGLVPIVTALAGLLVAYLTKLTQKVAADKDASVWHKVAGQAGHFATIVVRDLQVSMRPMLVEAAKDGKISKEEGEAIKKKAIERIKALLGEHGLDQLKGFIGQFNLDQYLGGLIESVLVDVKVQDQALAVPAQPPLS